MAYTTIDDPSVYFQTQLYTGDGNSTKAITNTGNSDLQPDWLWIKNRSSSGGTGPNMIFDSTRGPTKDLHVNNSEAEHTNSNTCKSFNTDGFTVGDGGVVNNNTDNFVAWQWKANGGTTSSNTDGSITSTVQANTTAGFSIVTYTGTGSTATVGHGLGVKPSVIIIKARTEPTGGVHFGSDQGNWIVYHQGTASDPETDLLLLNEYDAAVDSTGHMNDTAPTTSVFTIHTNVDVNESSDTYVAYCFAEKQGYSKFGSYTGNGNADGAFIYTGFKPAWVILKRSSGIADWNIFDNKRPNAFNEANGRLRANDNTTESTSDAGVDLLSNGFKCRLGSEFNASSTTNIYMAFAEHPFVSSKGVPTTAR
jgi:hypothetical protein